MLQFRSALFLKYAIDEAIRAENISERELQEKRWRS